MSERTAPALAILDTLLPALSELPDDPARSELIEEAEALRRAVAAFHLEAIRFRMYSVDRLLRAAGDPTPCRDLLEQARQALESSGFHTRSHSKP